MCTSEYWIATSLIPIIIVIYTVFSYKFLLEEERIKFHCGYDYDELDIIINDNSFKRIWVYGLLAGFLAGALGSGGGISLATLLLALGCHSRVASATTGLNNLWIGLISIIAVFTN